MPSDFIHNPGNGSLWKNDYKTGEKILEKSLEKINNFVEENNGEIEFVREHK